MLPSFSATRINLAEFLKNTGLRGVAGDRRRVRHGVAVAQIALLVVLLTGAGLLLRSYVNVLSVPTGFSATTVTASVEMSSEYGIVHKRRAFFGSLIDRIKSIPGMQAVGVVNALPLRTGKSRHCVRGGLSEHETSALGGMWDYSGLSFGNADAADRGTDISDEDEAEHRPVAIVSQAFAQNTLQMRTLSAAALATARTRATHGSR